MGQSFKPAFSLDNNHQYAISIRGSSKFTEWSFVEDSRMIAVVEHIKEINENSGKAVVYIHAGESSAKSKGYDFNGDDNINSIFSDRVTELNAVLQDVSDAGRYVKSLENLYFCNDRKNECVHLGEYVKQGNNKELPSDPNNMILHPLALLCCTEMQCSNSDYNGFVGGKRLNEGGRWLGDGITITDKKPTGYRDITSTLFLSFEASAYDEYLFECSRDFSQFFGSLDSKFSALNISRSEIDHAG